MTTPGTSHSGTAFALRAARLRWKCQLTWSRWRGATVDMSSRVGFYRTLWADAARAVSATVVEIAPGMWRIERGGARTFIHNYIVQLDDPVILNIAGDKPLCHAILTDAGLTVPAYRVYTLDETHLAEAFMAADPDACFVVKPAAGTSGARGVTTHIATVKECRRASALASLYGGRILIERWTPGESYRLLFLDGEMIHASRRRGRRLAGDGRRTIAQLIAAAGREGSENGNAAVEQRDVERTLMAQGLRMDSVPAEGASVLVQSAYPTPGGTAQIRTVFDEDATDEIGTELRDEARAAVRAIGSTFAGVDVITCNPRTSLAAAHGVINEINTTPGLHHHYGLSGARRDGRDPAVRVLSRVLVIADDRHP